MSGRRAPMPGLQLSLQLADARHREWLPRHFIARCLRRALVRPAQITVRIVDGSEGRRLNREFRGEDHATNVITFDYQHEPMVMADLVLCASVVAREAARMRIPVQAHYAHLLVHGCLHAQGMDHQTEAQAAQMEPRESEVMATLGWPDPYARSKSRPKSGLKPRARR